MTARAALAQRSFRLLFAGRSFSMFGNALAVVAIAFAVLEVTGSATSLGLVLAARAASELVFLLIGGVVADRLPRQRVIVGADLLAGLFQALAAFLLITDVIALWQLVVLEALNGACFAFFLPATTGLVPQTVPARLLQPANALLRLSVNGTQIVGAGIGGVLVAAVGPGTALAVDAATFLLSAGCFALMRLPEASVAATDRFLAQLRTGWREFRSRRWLLVIVAQFSIVNAAVNGALFVLGPLIALRELGGAAPWGVVLAAQSAGFLFGALLGLRFRPGRPLLAASLGVLLALPLLALLALAAPLPLLAAAAVVAGFGAEIFGVQWDTAMQTHIPGDVLSRVSSYDALGSVVFVPIGLVVAGPLAAQIGIASAVWAATVLVGVATLAALAVADVRNLPRADVA